MTIVELSLFPWYIKAHLDVSFVYYALSMSVTCVGMCLSIILQSSIWNSSILGTLHRPEMW